MPTTTYRSMSFADALAAGATSPLTEEIGEGAGYDLDKLGVFRLVDGVPVEWLGESAMPAAAVAQALQAAYERGASERAGELLPRTVPEGALEKLDSLAEDCTDAMYDGYDELTVAGLPVSTWDTAAILAEVIGALAPDMATPARRLAARYEALAAEGRKGQL